MALFHSIFIEEKKCILKIPKFQNSGKSSGKMILYSARIKNENWKIEKVICEYNKYFYHLSNIDLKDVVCFFYEKKNFLERVGVNNPFDFIDESFTKTHPAFRSNIRIENSLGGYSSYQSEYPISMAFKKGIIISSISVLTNKDAKKNILLFSNINSEPKKKQFTLYFVDVKKRKIVRTHSAYTNQTNLIEIEKSIITPNIFVCSNTYLGIPQYLSEKEGHLSFEHTHPPHEYIQSKDRFKRVNELKSALNEIIKENI